MEALEATHELCIGEFYENRAPYIFKLASLEWTNGAARRQHASHVKAFEGIGLLRFLKGILWIGLMRALGSQYFKTAIETHSCGFLT